MSRLKISGSKKNLRNNIMSNDWIEFMKSTKGSGMTMEQKRVAYRQQQAAVGKQVVHKTRSPKSACVGKSESNCLPPCSWAKGAKRQYCKAGPTRSARSPSPSAFRAPRSVLRPKELPRSRSPAPKKRSPYGPRPKLSPGLHSCVGLEEDPCEVAPNCYWQPNKKVCKTRSGAPVKKLMQGSERQSMLAQIRGQQGGYWW